MNFKKITLIGFFLIASIAMVCFLFINFVNARFANIQVVGPASVTKIQQAKLFFAGDLMFDRGIRYYANKFGGNDYIFSQITNFLNKNDLNIVNLEGPITDNASKSAGTAPGSANNYYFTFDPSIAGTLAKNNIKMVNLGNNHILNFGRKGLLATRDYLDKENIAYFGTPDNPRTALTEIKGIKFAFIGYNEFSDLGPELEEVSVINDIVKAKESSDIIIVYCHWGIEYEKIEYSTQKNTAHKFVDAGADLIIGSHPHVTQPVETYNGKRIYYSLGNFIFDQYFSEDTRNGLGVIVKVDENKNLNFEEINFYLADGGQTIIK
jgi:poly-gamma-glutamate synthesis protein (capsule biosynthesis protein)